MRPIWLIEAGVYGTEIEPLLEEVRRQGMAADLVPHQSLTRGVVPVIGGRPLAAGDCVLAYGTYPFAQQIQLHHDWKPGAWCNAVHLDCTTYFAHFGRYLLNQQYVMLPGMEAIRQRDWLYAVFGRDDEVFARPTGCLKLFNGRRITKGAFIDALAPTRYDHPATLVVIAAPRLIVREWRLVVAGDQVIAASQYAVDGERSVAPGCPENVHRFAETMLAEVRWRPDPLFMLDICESEGKLWLVELNGFSCSWLYQCNLQAVVACASERAALAWERAASIRTGCI